MQKKHKKCNHCEGYEELYLSCNNQLILVLVVAWLKVMIKRHTHICNHMHSSKIQRAAQLHGNRRVHTARQMKLDQSKLCEKVEVILQPPADLSSLYFGLKFSCETHILSHTELKDSDGHSVTSHHIKLQQRNWSVRSADCRLKHWKHKTNRKSDRHRHRRGHPTR